MRFIASSVILVVLLICMGCKDSVQDLVDRTRQAGTAEEWRTWATQVIGRSKTNSTPLLATELPEFVRRTGTHWQVSVQDSDSNTSSTKLVMLVSIGGFESIGIIIGSPSYVEVAPPHLPQISKLVYPGIYVRQVH